MKRLIILAIVALLPLVAAADHLGSDDLHAIQAVLDKQVAAWNRGDINGYMDGYARASDTMFVTTDTVTRGWQEVRDRYKAKYDTRAKMGTLAFSDIDFLQHTADIVVVTGAWKLTREADAPHGRFTLIFHRIGQGWKIVYDHSS